MSDMKKVLLVDDDPDFVDAVRIILEKEGYEVVVAYNGQEGMDEINGGFRPDVLVLDVMMPVMNGHQMCAKIKGDPKTEDIPVILLTAVADHVSTSKYTHRDMLESEAEDYLAKPVQPHDLLSRIKDII